MLLKGLPRSAPPETPFPAATISAFLISSLDASTFYFDVFGKVIYRGQ
jgi:hypothetical protein